MKQFIKDPQAILDYKQDWTAWLMDGDYIIASSWITSDDALVVDSNNFTDTDATVWLSGGIDKNKYLVTNSIKTNDGREDDRSFLIVCIEL